MAQGQHIVETVGFDAKKMNLLVSLPAIMKVVADSPSSCTVILETISILKQWNDRR